MRGSGACCAKGLSVKIALSIPSVLLLWRETYHRPYRIHLITNSEL
jgi:hypothetical protein